MLPAPIQREPLSLKKVLVRWKDADTSSVRDFFLGFLPRKAVVFKLPGYDGFHLTLCIKDPSEGAFGINLHLTDESKPEGSPERYVNVFATRPVAWEDLSRLGEWAKANVQSILPEFLKRSCDGMRLASHSDLLKEGWRGVLTKELFEAPFVQKKVLKLDEAELLDHVERSKESATYFMTKLLPDGSPDMTCFAMRIDKKDSTPTIEPIQAEADEPNEYDAAFQEWSKAQRASIKDPPYYLVLDQAKLQDVLIWVLDWLLEGAKQAFFDRDLKDACSRVQANLEKYVKGKDLEPLTSFLGFDLKELATPEQAKMAAAQAARPKTD